MPVPDVYTDEDVARSVVEALRTRGFVVLSTLESGLPGAHDDVQLLHATKLGCVLLSHNRRHFVRQHAAFVRRGRPHGGVILIPQDTVVERLVVRAAMMIDWLGSGAVYQSRLHQWNELQQQLIHGLRLPGYTEAEVRLALGWV